MKRCGSCEQDLPLTAFSADRQRLNTTGLQSYCRECAAAYRKDWHVRNTYGISLDVVRRMLKDQHGQCAICRDDISRRPGDAHIDHDHRLGKGNAGAVRGLLCGSCNRGLGMFRDDPARLAAAFAYLEAGVGRWTGISVSITHPEVAVALAQPADGGGQQ